MKEAKKAVADKLAAEEIEAKKTVRKAARTVKEVKEESSGAGQRSCSGQACR